LGNVSFNEVADDESVDILFSVNNSAPVIESVAIEDDLDELGVQILPKAGENRLVKFNVIANDPDGDLLNTVVSINGENYSVEGTNGTFVMRYYHSAGNYSVKVFVTDSSNETSTIETSYEYLELIALKLDA